jgi:excisionase family DNA binding protein
MTDEPEYMKVSEVAALLRLPEETVSRLLRTGQLPGIFAGRREGWRVKRSEVLNWTTNQPQNDHGINQTSGTGHGEER